MVNEINKQDMSSIDFRNIQGMNISKDEKLKKVAQEFEAVFMSQFLNMMDQTVEKTGFMSGGKGEEKFKSIINQYIAKDIATSPTASIGIAKQMYEQMKKYV